MTPTSISRLVRPVNTWNPGRQPDSEFAYIDLGSVDNVAKEVKAATPTMGAEAPSRARQLVEAGDVLVSTVRPNLNAVAMVPVELHGSTASTGFTVLRPTDRLDRRFLFHWVMSPMFIAEMVRKSTGASYPAVSDRIVKESKIPLPAVDEQRRIAAILDQAEAIRTKRRQLLTHFDALARSAYQEAVKGATDTATLRACGVDFVAGKNVVGSDLDSHPTNRIIKVSAISTGTFDAAEVKPMPEDYEPPFAHVLHRGDILFGRASGSLDLLGATAVVDTDVQDVYLPDKVWRLEVVTDRLNSAFALGALRSPHAREYIRHNASGAAGVRNISKAKLLGLEIPVIPRAQQDAFASLLSSITAQRANVERALSADDELFASLQSRAFRGDL